MKVTVIIPAYNEELVIGNLVREVKSVIGENDQVVVVDDCSCDNTGEEAKKAGALLISHPYNKGNGASVKTGMRKARGDVWITMDGDGQHNPDDIPRILEQITRYDMVVGARQKDSPAPGHRKLANKVYNSFASYLSNEKVQDLTSGFRAIKAEVAKKFIYLLPNHFSYPSTITLALFRAGYSVGYIPIKTRKRRSGKSKINIVSDGLKFILIILRIATLFTPLRVFLPMSFMFFVMGLTHAIYKIFSTPGGRYTGLSLFLMTTAVIIFMMGLIAEQIANLRLERSEE